MRTDFLALVFYGSFAFAAAAISRDDGRKVKEPKMPDVSAVINLDDKFGKVTKQRAPYIIAQFNDIHVKCVRAFGEFVWHKHDDTDELFYVHKGDLVIHYRDRDVRLRAGEMHVVPRGVEHKPYAEAECEVLLIEPAGTLNTGDAGGAMTVADEPWL